MSDYLAEELVEKILIRIPIKTLLRFTIVCKRWYNLLCSPEFINAHLNFTKLIKNSSRKLIVYSKKKDVIVNGNPKFKSNYIVCSDGDDRNLQINVAFEFPSDGVYHNMNPVGCCNGLVCLPVIYATYTKPVVVLWNPMIRRVFHLPKSDVESRLDKLHYTFGFVFDRVKNDYKVLRFYRGFNGDPPLIEIFRLSTGLWDVVAHEPPFALISLRSKQVDLHGIAHWIGKQSDRKLKIVTFDPHHEKFGSMDLPVKEGKKPFYPGWETYLFVYEKSLFLIELFYRDYSMMPFPKIGHFCIWKMNEYGIVESWTRLRNFVFDFSVRPLGFRMNGEILWAARSRKFISQLLRKGCKSILIHVRLQLVSIHVQIMWKVSSCLINPYRTSLSLHRKNHLNRIFIMSTSETRLIGPK